MKGRSVVGVEDRRIDGLFRRAAVGRLGRANALLHKALVAVVLGPRAKVQRHKENGEEERERARDRDADNDVGHARLTLEIGAFTTNGGHQRRNSEFRLYREIKGGWCDWIMGLSYGIGLWDWVQGKR